MGFLSDRERNDFEFEWILVTALLRSGGRMRLPKGTIRKWKADVKAAQKEAEERRARGWS